MKFAKKIIEILLFVFIFDINIKMQIVNQIGANIELSQFDDSNILIDGYLVRFGNREDVLTPINNQNTENTNA